MSNFQEEKRAGRWTQAHNRLQRWIDRVNGLKPEYEDEGGLLWKLWDERRTGAVIPVNSRRARPQINFDKLMKRNGERELHRVRCHRCTDLQSPEREGVKRSAQLVREGLTSTRKQRYAHPECIRIGGATAKSLFERVTGLKSTPIAEPLHMASEVLG